MVSFTWPNLLLTALTVSHTTRRPPSQSFHSASFGQFFTQSTGFRVALSCSYPRFTQGCAEILVLVGETTWFSQNRRYLGFLNTRGIRILRKKKYQTMCCQYSSRFYICARSWGFKPRVFNPVLKLCTHGGMETKCKLTLHTRILSTCREQETPNLVHHMQLPPPIHPQP